MDLIALSRLGGRHLVTLHLLLDNQSVTRTAERLCTTPSTVSKTLNQLRDLLGINCSTARATSCCSPPLPNGWPRPCTDW